MTIKELQAFLDRVNEDAEVFILDEDKLGWLEPVVESDGMYDPVDDRVHPVVVFKPYRKE